MLAVTDLPVEILLKLVGECSDLRGVNKQFYRLSNEYYRNQVFGLLRCNMNLENYNWFWECCEIDLRNYVKSLDFLRQDSREIISTDTPFIEDSWKIIYNVLNSTTNCRNTRKLMRNSDSLDYHRPIFTGRSTLPYSKVDNQIPINGWFHIKSLEGTFKLATVVTEIRISPYDKYKTISLPTNVKDFIKEPGVYCFNMGKIPKFDVLDNTIKPPVVPFEIRLMERTMTPPSYFEHSNLEFLGYDFVPYEGKKPWIFFRIDEEFKDTIFNPIETCLSESLVRFTKTFRQPNLGLRRPSMEESIVPYFDPSKKSIRNFNYKYPKDKPDLHKEIVVADWRAPHLKS